MRHLTRGGGSATPRRARRVRSLALVATFLLLMAGMIVSNPSLMSVSAGTKPGAPNSEPSGDGQGNGHDGDHAGDESANDNDGNDDGEGHDEEGNKSEDEGDDGSSGNSDSEKVITGLGLNTDTSGDGNQRHQRLPRRGNHDDGDHDDGDHDDEDHDGNHEGDHDGDAPCVATIEVHKVPANTHGGNLQAADFTLLLDGQPQRQLIATPVTPDVAHVVSEAPQPGYTLRVILCTDLDTGAQVSGTGTVTLSAGQRVSCEVTNDDIAPTITVHKSVNNDNGGSAAAEDFHLTLNGAPIAQGVPSDELLANSPSVISEDNSVPGYAPTKVVCTSDVAGSPNNKTAPGTGTITITPALAENIDCTITNDDMAPGLTVVKALVKDDGGNEQVTDFPLQVNGATVASGALIGYQANVSLAITEVQQAGYLASNIHCVSSNPNSANNINIDNPTGTPLAIVTLAAGEAVVCTITNDDIAPTVTVHKAVVGGTKTAAEFQMTVGGQPQPQDTAINTVANTAVEVSEVADPNYTTSVTCVDKTDNSPLVNPLILNEGQNATCTVTNTFNSPTITLIKEVLNSWGGQLVPRDFQLKIDDIDVSQGVPHDVSAGPHTISELPRPGYAQTGIVCIDAVTKLPVGQAGSVNLVAGQDVTCTVSNADQPAALTLTKAVKNDNGGTARPADFQLKIDGINTPQGQPNSVRSGLHTLTEQPVIDYRLISITCTDDVTQQTLIYDNGITLALGQHVSCIMTNDDDPLDLAITKSDNGLVQTAGGGPFDYAIAVDNLGPRDARSTEAVTVTDRLPVGFAFVSFPTTCTAVGQTLTCLVDPAGLHVADVPVVITVRVRALPDAVSGIYTNIAYVNTTDDPACVGAGCVPVCGAITNNIACETTQINRTATMTIAKVDNVEGGIRPGVSFSYFIDIGNLGPSTFLANMAMIDDLPDGLVFESVSAPAPWICNDVDPVVCNYGIALQPGTTAPRITINTHLDPNSTSSVILNEAKALAIVDPPSAAIVALAADVIPPPADPGTVVTATDDETTVIVRQVNLSIDKSVSQGTATAGNQFNWILDITNHGPDMATNVVISDTIPTQFEVIGTFPTDGLSCTTAANAVQCTAPTLASGATVRTVVQVRVLASAPPGAVTNTATVATGSSDTDITDNTGSASITVTAAVNQAVAVPDPGTGASGIATLPRTGNGPLGGPLTLAALMFGAGIFSLVIGRRRRAETT